MRELKFAFVKVFPIMFSYLVLGIACGILYKENGFSFLELFFSSTIVYSGALQFVLAPLIVSGASFIVIAFLSVILSGRHLFYGITMIGEIDINSFMEFYTAASLTDETFSIVSSIDKYENLNYKKVYFFINLIAHLTWIISTLIGFLLGDIIPFDTTGIEFSATALFVAIAVSQSEKAGILLPQILAIISSVLAMCIIGKQNFILLGMVITMITLLIFKRQIKERLGRK